MFHRFRPRHHLQPAKLKYRFNTLIQAPEVRVIDENGQNIGVYPTLEAVKMAKERGFDLIEVFPAATPPVCKIISLGQFHYQEKKKLQKQKLKQKRVEVKGVRLSLNIGKHDLENRINQAKKFFAEGNLVKVEIILTGREKQHPEVAREVMTNFISSLGEIVIDQAITRQGGKLFMIVRQVAA